MVLVGSSSASQCPVAPHWPQPQLCHSNHSLFHSSVFSWMNSLVFNKSKIKHLKRHQHSPVGIMIIHQMVERSKSSSLWNDLSWPEPITPFLSCSSHRAALWEWSVRDHRPITVLSLRASLIEPQSAIFLQPCAWLRTGESLVECNTAGQSPLSVALFQPTLHCRWSTPGGSTRSLPQRQRVTPSLSGSSGLSKV